VLYIHNEIKLSFKGNNLWIIQAMRDKYIYRFNHLIMA